MNGDNMNGSVDHSFQMSLWIACQAANIVFVATSFYFFVTLLIWSENLKRTRKDKCPVRLVNLALISLFMALLTFMLAQAELVVPWIDQPAGERGDHSCEMLIDSLIVVYSTAYLLPYLFLWYRVRILYKQNSLKRLYSKLIKTLSFIAFFLIFAGYAFHVILVVTPHNHQWTVAGCKQQKVVSWVAYIAHGFKFILHSILFGLIFYPLQHTWPGILLSTPENRVMAETRRHVIRSLRFAFVSLVLCLSSDLMVSILDSEVLPPLALCSLINLIWNVNLLINVLSITLCFDGFRKGVFDKLMGIFVRRRESTTDEATTVVILQQKPNERKTNLSAADFAPTVVPTTLLTRN